MAIRVLIVDDSAFFRKRLTEIITGDSTLEVCGEAKDGREGVDLAAKLRPDVITMDVEMPVMDGITAVKEIMAKTPTPILMFSSLTVEGASSTFKALEAGAIDFMPKNFDDIAHRREDALNQLRASIKAVSKSRVGRRTSFVASSTTTTARTTTSLTTRATSALGSTRSTTSTLASTRTATLQTAPTNKSALDSSHMAYEKIQTQLANVDQGKPAAAMKFTFGDNADKTTIFKKSGKRHDLIAIGSSTGGPIALQNVIPKLPLLNVPIVIIQHMPPAFTTTFAQRLDALSQYTVVEAKDGDILEPNHCYIAPGGMQMIFERALGKTKVRILKGDNRVVYHPCVDVSFASLAQQYGGKVLSIILTGMGSDGCEGCRLFKKQGGVVWAQNEETCVVYGMPQAVVNAGISDQVLPLEKIAGYIVEEMKP